MIAALTQSEYRALFVSSLILVVVVIVGFAVVVWIKRRVQQEDLQPPIGFSLADLRELHRTGKISDQEFERARGKMAASLKHEISEKPKNPA